jgi:hypothetical protein
MHTPITTLKSAALDPGSTTVVDVVRKLFNLRDERRPEPVLPPITPAPEQELATETVPASPSLTNQTQK